MYYRFIEWLNKFPLRSDDSLRKLHAAMREQRLTLLPYRLWRIGWITTFEQWARGWPCRTCRKPGLAHRALEIYCRWRCRWIGE